MITLREALAQGRQQLTKLQDSAQIDAECLLAFVLKKSRTYLYTHADKLLSVDELQQFLTLIQARLQGQPIAYLIGQREFWSLSLSVSKDTLIPRPETEHLVERALIHLNTIPHAHILDLGTGTGAVALALAKERPDCKIWAVDINPKALAIAKQNASQHHLINVQFYESNWFNAIPASSKFDMIVSNPPYLAENDPHSKQGDLRFEPQGALISGPSGLEAFNTIIREAKSFLKEEGWLCLEHGSTQKTELQNLLEIHGYNHLGTFKDYQGLDRITEGRFNIHQS